MSISHSNLLSKSMIVTHLSYTFMYPLQLDGWYNCSLFYGLSVARTLQPIGSSIVTHDHLLAVSKGLHVRVYLPLASLTTELRRQLSICINIVHTGMLLGFLDR